MDKLQLVATQDFNNLLFYNNDQNRLLVNFESSWDEGEYLLESVAVLDLTTGEVEVISGIVTNDGILNQLEHLDSESIFINGAFMDAEDCSLSQDDLDNINIKVAEHVKNKHTHKDAWAMLVNATISIASQISSLHHLYVGYDLTALQKTDMLVQYVMFMYHNRDTLDEYKPDIMIRRKESLGRLIDRSISDHHITAESLIAAATVNNDYERVTHAVDSDHAQIGGVSIIF